MLPNFLHGPIQLRRTLHVIFPFGMCKNIHAANQWGIRFHIDIHLLEIISKFVYLSRKNKTGYKISLPGLIFSCYGVAVGVVVGSGIEVAVSSGGVVGIGVGVPVGGRAG